MPRIAAEKAQELSEAMVLIGRLAEATCVDMKGRLADDEHKRAYRSLRRIAEMARQVLDH